MPKYEKQIEAPAAGAFLGWNPKRVPPNGASRLENFRVENGIARSRHGSVQLFTPPDTNRVIDIFNLRFADGTVETMRLGIDATPSTTNGLHRATNSAWDAVTLATALAGTVDDRFFAVVTPWASESRGRIVFGTLSDPPQTWTGTSNDTVDLDTAAIVDGAKFAIVGDDNRLFFGHTNEAGEARQQRVRWSTVALAAGTSDDWDGTDPGSGALDLRNDNWPITGFWKQGGRIYVGKERGICVLNATGVATDAYGFEALQTDGDGLFAPHSVVQFGSVVAFISHRDVLLFEANSLVSAGGPMRKELLRRLNKGALDQVTGVVDATNNRIGWGLPLDGSAVPTEIWWLEPGTGRWEVDKRAHTAVSLYTNVDVTTIDELLEGEAGGDDEIVDLVGTINAQSASATPEATIIYGRSNGSVAQILTTAKTDEGAAIVCLIETRNLDPIGDQLTIAGQPHTIIEDDILVIDEIAATLLDYGDTYTVEISASGDGGSSFTALGNITVTTNGGTVDIPKFVPVQVHGRISATDGIMVRLKNITADILWGWSDITPKIDVVGRKR